MLFVLSVPVVALLGQLTLWHRYAVVGRSGILTVLFTVAYRGQLPRLVHTTRFIDSNGNLGTAERWPS